jgi:hypothetical protein
MVLLSAHIVTISVEPQDSFGATISTIDEVGPTRFVTHKPDVVPDICLWKTAIGYERWSRTVIDRFAGRLRQDGNLIQGRWLVKAPFCRSFSRTFDPVLLRLR